MIQLSSAGKHFGAKTLFQELNWVVGAKERVGLVGGNGTGKSTLLKVLAGMETLDEGSRSAAKDTTTGYLPQDGLSLSGRTVLEECLSVFGHLLDIEREMETLTHKMAELDPSSNEYEKVADRYHRIETEFQRNDGYSLEAQVGAVLNGLGFSRDDAKRAVEEFSGGWQMRVGLAKLLLRKPNLLLLDEPTNHLDLEARNWLEEYLNNYPFAYVLVSHDRYFLDVTVDRILEIWNRHTYFYTGNYDRYLEQKAERRVQLEASQKNQQEQIHHLETFINRFRYQATKARQVQSRIKELEKIDKIELPDEERAIHFSFPQPRPSGRMVAELRNVAKSYGEKSVFENVSFVLNRGDRVALVGVNGAGKSTLIKLLSGAEPVTKGEMRLGHNVELDYFAQDQYKALNPDARLLDDLTSFAPTAVSNQTQLRTLLGSFLFSHDDVFKRIGVLSGGERNRYALARMLLRPANFLLLDEPTNHLDLQAKDVLLEALRKFTGTIVFVSHDRYFIDKLATRIFEIERGKLQDYPGNYEDYLWQKERTGAEPADSAAKPRTPEPGASVGPGERQKRVKRTNPSSVRKMEKERDELEEQISRCEAEITSLELELGQFKSAEESIRISGLIETQRTRLKEITKQWEELVVKLERERPSDESQIPSSKAD
jgi:ATP-binding cassette, subfamily F, member 3